MTPRQRRFVELLPALVAVVTLGVAGLLAVLGFGTATAVVGVVGWCLLTPLSAILGREVLDVGSEADGEADRVERRDARAAEDPAPSDPVDRLRERYAEGDIDEAEFERRLDALLDTEDADAETARERLRERNS